MQNELLAKDALPDRVAGRISRAMAARFPRRSFFGRVGVYAAAATVGGGALSLLSQEAALAGGCGCNGYESVSCGCLTGSNSCPSGTCGCGCWAVCGGCGDYAKMWCDCCNESYHSARCVSSCSSDPSNCFTKDYAGGCAPGYTIRCRYWYCNHSLIC